MPLERPCCSILHYLFLSFCCIRSASGATSPCFGNSGWARAACQCLGRQPPQPHWLQARRNCCPVLARSANQKQLLSVQTHINKVARNARLTAGQRMSPPLMGQSRRASGPAANDHLERCKKSLTPHQDRFRSSKSDWVVLLRSATHTTRASQLTRCASANKTHRLT